MSQGYYLNIVEKATLSFVYREEISLEEVLSLEIDTTQIKRLKGGENEYITSYSLLGEVKRSGNVGLLSKISATVIEDRADELFAILTYQEPLAYIPVNELEKGKRYIDAIEGAARKFLL